MLKKILADKMKEAVSKSIDSLAGQNAAAQGTTQNIMQEALKMMGANAPAGMQDVMQQALATFSDPAQQEALAQAPEQMEQQAALMQEQQEVMKQSIEQSIQGEGAADFVQVMQAMQSVGSQQGSSSAGSACETPTLEELGKRMTDIQKEMQEASAKGEYNKVIELSKEIGLVQAQIFQRSAGTQQMLSGLNAQAEAAKAKARGAQSRQQAAPAGSTTLNYQNGDRYTGAVLNRKPHGKGTYFSKNGNRYEGEFANGERNGRGTFFYAGGARYEGDWKNGKMHGKGAYFYAKGDVYEGDFKDNQQTGKGKFTGRRGDVYEGDFLDDKKHGKGKEFTPHMSKAQHGDYLYEGEWKDDRKHGYGVFDMMTAGVRYEGFWEDGNYHGKGKMIYYGKTENTEIGDWLECNFVSSQGVGKGVYHFADGRRYEGDFKQTEMNGKGKLYYPNGDVYEVEFADNKMQGKGVKIS